MSTPAASPEERRALLAQMLREKARATRTTAPLSYGQAALWFTYQLAPDSPAYNLAFAATVRSPVDVAALGRAFQILVDRHAALRTTFRTVDGKPVQEIAGAADLYFATVDAAGWDVAELHRQVETAYQLPFDLEQGPLLRVYLFTRAPDEHVLLMVVHHIVFDGWSMGILLDEFQSLYRAECGGDPAQLPPVQVQYKDFAVWQHEQLAGAAGQRLRAYWRSKLSGTLPVLDLPLDHARPALQTFRGASQEVQLPRTLVQQVRALAKAEHTTLYSVLLAAFYVLLHRYSGQDDLIIGTPMLGRSRAEFQRTIGYFVSPVALRALVPGSEPFREFLGQVRQVVLEGLEHQDYPFARLVEELQPRRDPGRSPIIEAMFNLQQTQYFGNVADRMLHEDGSTSYELGRLKLEVFSLSQEEGQFDLTLLVLESGDDLFGSLKYNPDLFDHSTIERMAAHYTQLLESIVADPSVSVGALPMLTAAELEQFEQWNATTAAYPTDQCIHDLVAAQAARTPAAIAVRCADQTLTYGELERRSNQLAAFLRTVQVGPGTLVGILLDRTVDMPIALLGVLKAGAAYVPLDPAFPTERLAFMLEDTRAAVLLTQQSLAGSVPAPHARIVCVDSDAALIAAHADQPLSASAHAEDLAYVIFTSGSTGRPKGVQIPHRAVVNFLVSMAQRPGLTDNDKLAAVTTLSFDIAALELFLPLTVGAQIVLVSRETAGDGAALAVLLERAGTTVMQATPVTWRLLLSANWQPKPGFKALCGGEALPAQLAQQLLDLGIELWNMYGPTETTIWSTVQPISSAAPPILVGRPIANTRAYVLNQERAAVPIGVVGELYLGGDGLARGYLNRPELTAERFITAAPTGVDWRLYNTGDLARYLSDGTIEVLGRSDHQVKIRGFRIELGEIETALVHHPAVREAVVTAHTDQRGDRRLVAYLTVGDGARPGAGELRSFLRQTLPDYMIPSAFLFLEQLPLTANGKIDRRALPAPEPVRARGNEGYAPPSTPTEQAIAAVWRELLGLDRVSIYDNFFDLGGHSLIAMESLARLERQLGAKLGPADIRLQTLGQLAAAYDRAIAQPPPPPPPAEERQGLAGRLFGAVRRIITPERT